MALVGSAALGTVLGWVSVLVGRWTRGVLGVSWRAAAFACIALLGSAAIAFAYARTQGSIAASVGFGVGAFAAAAILGTRSPQSQDLSKEE